MSKLFVNLIIVSLMISVLHCTKKKDDSSSLLSGLVLLNSSRSATGSSGSVAVEANVPIGRKVTATAGSTLSQVVNIPRGTNSFRNSENAKSVLGASGTITLSIFKTDGSAITGCPNAVSAPGATSVTLNCTVPEAGSFIIQLVSTVAANISFEAVSGGTLEVTSGGTAAFQPISVVLAADNPIISVTKNIFLGGIFTRNFLFLNIVRINPSANATDISDAIVTAKFKNNAEVTLNYNCVIASFCGYSNNSSPLVPNSNSPAVGGDTLQVKITPADRSWSLDRTVTYPNSVSNVRIGGTALANNAIYTISRARGTTITWDNPTSNPPQFVQLTPGDNVGDLTKLPWSGLFQVSASSGSATISVAQMSAYTSVSTTNSTDNCIGVAGSFVGNYTFHPSFYSGFARATNGTLIQFNSQWIVSNSQGLLAYDNSNTDGLACESGATFNSVAWASTRPRLVVTD